MLRFSTAIFLTAIAVAAQLQIPNTLPPSCTSGTCQSLVNKFSNPSAATACASNTTCLCTNNVVSGIKGCLQCQVDAKAIEQQTADNVVSGILDECQHVGHPVSSATSLKMSGFAAAAALSGFILL